MKTEDAIAPSYVKERRISLQLDPSASEPTANTSLVVLVNYSDALPEGISLPLVMEVQGPSSASYQRRGFLRSAPLSLVVTPREGGLYTVILREAAHNRWWGSVSFTARGDQLTRGQ